MYFKIGDQLEFITKYITLNPGDLILTGTPNGIGPIEKWEINYMLL
jgi:2-keto-4-pentenoate hydratase/2-oxohepta-3-ene-1,7-dioic acid hydratase in catechol pathway